MEFGIGASPSWLEGQRPPMACLMFAFPFSLAAAHHLIGLALSTTNSPRLQFIGHACWQLYFWGWKSYLIELRIILVVWLSSTGLSLDSSAVRHNSGNAARSRRLHKLRMRLVLN